MGLKMLPLGKWRGQTVAVDSMVFIYVFEATKSYFEICSRILTAAEKHQFQLVTSVISVLEALSPSKYQKSPEIASEVSQFFDEVPGLTIVPVDLQVVRLAAKLRRVNQSLRTPDSIQLATAHLAGVTALVTNDKQLKSFSGLPFVVISLSDYI